MIFDAVLDELVARYPDRLVRQSATSMPNAGCSIPPPSSMFVGAGHRRRLLRLRAEGFMSVVTSALPGPGKVFIEDFDAAPQVQSTADAPSRPRRGRETAGPSRSTWTARRRRCPRVGGRDAAGKRAAGGPVAAVFLRGGQLRDMHRAS